MGWREVQTIRFETEAAEEKRDETQSLTGERVHFGGRDQGCTQLSGRSSLANQERHGVACGNDGDVCFSGRAVLGSGFEFGNLE